VGGVARFHACAAMWVTGACRAVYEDGKVCISILHPPGEDRFNEQEHPDERWRPILGVESIIISVISMLSDPNDESPANIDAAVSAWIPLGKRHSRFLTRRDPWSVCTCADRQVQWRSDKAGFKKRVRQVVRKSQEDL
jgi:ubiquitin-conjugating enzyme E2 G1